MKIYISGKITGLPIEEAKENFAKAEAILKEHGHEVINPMTLVPYSPELTWKDYMIKDIDALMDCEAITMLTNWGDSRGARIERAIAIEMGLLIKYQ